MAGIPAGRLSIEIVAEIARLQADLDKAKRAVNAASGDIAKSARAANDNLAAIGRGAGAGMQQFSKDVAALKARLDPAWASMQSYRQEVALAQRALQQGAITHAQYVDAVRQAASAAGLLSDKQKETAASAQMVAQAEREAAQGAQAAAAAAQDAARQQAVYASQAANVRAQLDPMFAAQQRFNQQMDMLDNLLREGALRQHEYAAATSQARAALQDHAQAIMRTEAVLDDVGTELKKSSGNARNFSLQMSQVGQQVMAGTGVIQALAIQLPDMTAGMSAAQEGAGRFASFMGGPWGIAATTAIGLIATFTIKLLEEGDAIDASVEKLRKEAAQTAASAAAKAEFGRSLDGVVEAIRAQNEELEKSIVTSRQAEINTYNHAASLRRQALDTREATVALLEHQKVLAENAKSQNVFAGGPGGAQSIVENQYAAEVERVQKRLDTANKAVAKAERDVRLAEIPRNQRAVAEAIDAVAAATGRYERNLQKLNNQRAAGTISQKRYIELETAAQVTRDKAIKAAEDAKKKPAGPTADQRRAERLGRESVATETLVAGLYKLADAYGVSDAAAMRAEVSARAQEQGIKKQADVASFVAQQIRKATAEQVVSGAQAAADLNQQVRAQNFVNDAVRAGKLDADNAATALSNMAEQRGLLTAMNAAGADGDVQGYEAAKKALQALTKAQLADIKARRDAADLQQAAQTDRSSEATRLETKLLQDLGAARLKALRGLTGAPLEDELARIAAEHEKIGIQVRAEAEAARLLKLGYDDAAAAVLRKAQADKAQVDARLEIDKQTVAVERYNDRLRDTIGLLGSMGKVGEGLGALLGLLSGTPGSVRGQIGDFLNIGIGDRDDTAKTIGTELAKVFKKDGAFVKAMQPMLQGAGIGMGAAQTLFGQQSIKEQVGSALGGAAGGKLGNVLGKTMEASSSKILKGLGSMAGPLGSIAGGIIGNVVGGLFTKAKWGRVDLSSAGVSGTSGNNGSSEKAALAAGNSIYDGLQDLAKQFGGGIGNFGNIAVGVRKGDYRVNAGGTSLKVKKGAVDFGDDAEAAVAYAMKLAIERGAINGIRQSTNNLLKAGDDLSAQISKALAFEGVFTELKASLDPVGAELDALDKEFANLRSIFAEAGATAAEYAQLEQLLSIKRQEAMDKEQDALNEIRSRIAEVQGDDATVTAIARAKELKDASSDAQRALLQQLYAAEDAKTAQDALTAAQEAAASAADQLRQTWASIGNDLMDEVRRIRGLTGGDSAASFASLQGQFNAAVTAARSGDQAAAEKLVELSQALLESAGNVATSRQELERIKAETAARLEGVYESIGSPSASSSASTSSLSALSASVADKGSGSTNAQASDTLAEMRAMRAEMAGMRAELNAANATIARETRRSADGIDTALRNGGGDALAVASAA